MQKGVIPGSTLSCTWYVLVSFALAIPDVALEGFQSPRLLRLQQVTVVRYETLFNWHSFANFCCATCHDLTIIQDLALVPAHERDNAQLPSLPFDLSALPNCVCSAHFLLFCLVARRSRQTRAQVRSFACQKRGVICSRHLLGSFHEPVDDRN